MYLQLRSLFLQNATESHIQLSSGQSTLCNCNLVCLKLSLSSLIHFVSTGISSYPKFPGKKNLSDNLDFALSLTGHIHSTIQVLSILLPSKVRNVLLNSSTSPFLCHIIFILVHYYFLSELLQKVLNCYACSFLIHSLHGTLKQTDLSKKQILQCPLSV